MNTKELKIKQFVDYIKDNNISISTAESCTGGLLASYITDYPGISKVFRGGIVTYSDDAKNKLIGVSDESIQKYTVYSPQVAKEMAIGVRNMFNTDIGVSTTGLAGPHNIIKDKPVGLVYIGVSYQDKVESFELNLNGDRKQIKKMACLKAFEILSNIFTKKN